ncbi:uncharacterized protein LOC132273828 [Cornus florida]|uniref:uncharacterized protein LOC132273828 n=1 Tax=Cornus florida TaxID=4283 RepID=UPI00289EDFCA|nr:uncharacterized protein LOC132273828 [Cornus florida]XP_059630892.1 uncharacterized protein LOC132273828 [Cornus florida]XP_059630893.1 uncharacterized protein LOC132273828 [Cornus florida]
MGDHSSRSNRTKKKRRSEDTTTPSPSSSSPPSSDEVEPSAKRHRGRRSQHHRSDGSSRREREKRRERKRRERKEREKKHRRSRREGKRKYSDTESDGESESDASGDKLEPVSPRNEPEGVVRYILKKFPGVEGDLEQLLRMIDDGQAVDIKGLSEKSLVKHLKKLFQSLNLKENGDQVFLLPSNVRPTLEVVGPIICSHMEPQQQQFDHLGSPNDIHSVPLTTDRQGVDDTDSNLEMPCPVEDIAAPRRRTIGPEMPSAELLAAAAKLTEAEADLREAELEEDTGVFIGPPPPALVIEAESANEAERFEEVTRIMGVEVDSPYDVLGVNRNMLADNMKKRYWKLSLMVHPDKCPHPQANQAFIKLNKAFKDLQDPEKRKALDDKIRLKEEQEAFKKELKVLREAAQWRRLQGISMEGDDELLAELDVKVEPKRDEWMTTLPPERKPGVTSQTTKFSRTSKGRGDTSAWTDTPTDKSQKAKMNYLEAYNEAAALASKEEDNKRANSDAQLVDEYNKAKRSKSLVEKHQEDTRSRSKRKSKQEPLTKEEWEGQHPWKPWDREKDLTAGRQSVKLDADNMSQGLTSRFSSGSFQRNFL